MAVSVARQQRSRRVLGAAYRVALRVARTVTHPLFRAVLALIAVAVVMLALVCIARRVAEAVAEPFTAAAAVGEALSPIGTVVRIRAIAAVERAAGRVARLVAIAVVCELYAHEGAIIGPR